MHLSRTFAVSLSLAAVAVAQDRVTLANGDVLTGKVRNMTDGNVTFDSPFAGDVTVPFADVQNLTTDEPVKLQTVTGETFKRRIAGIENASLRLDGDGPAVPVDSLSAINPQEAEAPKWTGSVALNGLWIDGNTRRRSIGAAGEASRKTDADRITVDASWDYSEDKPTGGPWNLTSRRAGAGAKYDYFLNDRWYALASARVLGDTFADIDLRYTVGAGVGYTAVDNQTTLLLTEVGLSWVSETYRSNAPDSEYIAARLAYRLQHQINERTKLTHGVEAFPSLENKDDIYLQMKTEVTNSLTENMIASLAWIMDYDNTPSPGLKRADHRVVVSLGWTF